MKNYKEIQNILKNVANNNSNLSLVDTNLGISIIGFENSQEIDKINKDLKDSLKNYIERCRSEKKKEELERMMVVSQCLEIDDGQKLWKVVKRLRCEDYFDMFDIKTNDNRQFYTKDSYESEAEFIENELLNMGLFDNCSSFDDIQDLVKRYGELWKAIESLKDGEIVVLDEESWCFKKIERYMTSYHEGYYTYAIALSII